MALKDNIKKRREELGITLEEVAKTVGVTRQTIQKYESGIIANIPSDKIELLAIALKTSPSFLMGWEKPKKEIIYNNIYSRFPEPNIADNCVPVPVIGEVAAGYDHLAIENWDGDTVNIPAEYFKGHSKKDFFVLTVHGDSMYPLFLEGDKVLVLKQSTLDKSGDIGVIIYDNDVATLKKIEFVKGENWLTMIPLNPNYPPKKITGTDLELCRIIGVPKLVIREWK